jgi:hypothetical protein
LLACVAVVAGCKAKVAQPDPAPVAAPLPPVASAHPAEAPVPVPPVPDDPLAAMFPDAAPAPALSPADARLHALARLLTIDFRVYQIVEDFPGVATTTTFNTDRFEWKNGKDASSGGGPELPALAAEVAAISDDDPAVRDYARALADWLPALADLHAYYDDDHYVDDEFARGRREQPELAKRAAAIAKLRGPMRAAATEAWRAQIAAHPGSPRALIGHGWLACTAVADQVLRRGGDDAVAAAVSGCRQAIAPIEGLGSAAYLGDEVRNVAIALGDWVASDRPAIDDDPSLELGKLTDAVLEAWPALSATPAEQP